MWHVLDCEYPEIAKEENEHNHLQYFYFTYGNNLLCIFTIFKITKILPIANYVVVNFLLMQSWLGISEVGGLLFPLIQTQHLECKTMLNTKLLLRSNNLSDYIFTVLLETFGYINQNPSCC